MSKRTLLLNANYEIISFLSERRVFKLLSKGDKVEPISFWDNEISFGSSRIYYPATLKMMYDVKMPYTSKSFSRTALVKRDRSICQYCSRKLSPIQVTIDHIVPRSKGGKTSFTNCVVACQQCNNFKNNKTLEESKMKLLKEPVNPNFNSNVFLDDRVDGWHEDWNMFIKRQ